MKKYEVHLYERVYKTLMYEVEARGEKEAVRKAMKEYNVDGPDDEWINGSEIEGSKIFLMGGSNE